MQIKIKTVTNEIIDLQIQSDDTILRVKDRIQEKMGIPKEHQRLIYSGKQLEDDRTLPDYNIQKDSTILLWMRSVSTDKKLNDRPSRLDNIVQNGKALHYPPPTAR
ncbi:unnamed protein product [Rodentolepis nana]|uniref:Ubiquitin-like domain-containing protein n=1 Tax=Rodentolepis nana TaxID=102285 RepID=A0A0R3T7F8_RODNA|nr:unnamed protein product [Rodentolepis nana]